MRHIYIASCDLSGGIHHYTFDQGKLRFCEKVDLDRPMYTVINGDRALVLLKRVFDDTGFGGLVGFDIDKDGRLVNATPVLPSQGIVPCHLCAQGDDVYAVNYLSGNVVKFPDRVVAHKGKGVHPTRQDMAHTHFVTLTDDKKYLICTDLGVDTVFVYDRDLNPVSGAKVPDGSGPRHLCIDGGYVYCVNELSNDVSVFSFKDGNLTLLGTYAAIPEFKGQSTAAAIRLYNGRLYVSHRGADCISCFEIRGEKLELLWNTPCGGHAPRDFDIVDGYIICTNEGGNVAVLKLNDGGAEVVSDDIKMLDPLCVTVMDLEEI